MPGNGSKISKGFKNGDEEGGVKGILKWARSQFPGSEDEEEPEEEAPDAGESPAPKKKLTYKEKVSKIKPFGE